MAYWWRRTELWTVMGWRAQNRQPTHTSTWSPILLLTVLLCLGLGGCGGTSPEERPALEFSGAGFPAESGSFPNWPYPPQALESLLDEVLASGDFELTARKKTEHGGSGPSQITLYFPRIEKQIKFKWKEVPPRELETVNNSPRKEIAAYKIQKLFLDPEDYVVPTTLLHCEPLDRYAKKDWAYRPSVPGTNCVLGVLAVWLTDVTMVETLYDEERFIKDPDYAHYMANFNLLTYLIDHKDTRESNFLVSKNDARRQVFSVDNGIAFQPFLYKFFAENWDVIRVAGLRSAYVERLRRLRREDLDVLGVVAEMEKDERGVLVSVKPRRNLSPNEGIRLREDVLQIGLAKFEIERIWERIQGLLKEVDSGAIPVF